MDITKRIKAIRAEAERKIGFPLGQGFWDIIDEDVGNVPQDFDGDPESQEVYIQDYEDTVSRYLKAISNAIKTKPSTKGNGQPKKPKKAYHKCSNRRIYLIDFIEDKGLNSGTNRINWKRAVTEWNNTHPSDTMSLPVLKAGYYRAKEKNLTPEKFNQFLTRMNNEGRTLRDVALIADKVEKEANIEWRKAHGFGLKE